MDTSYTLARREHDLTPEEICRRLPCSRHTLRGYLASGQLRDLSPTAVEDLRVALRRDRDAPRDSDAPPTD